MTTWMIALAAHEAVAVPVGLAMGWAMADETPWWFSFPACLLMAQAWEVFWIGGAVAAVLR